MLPTVSWLGLRPTSIFLLFVSGVGEISRDAARRVAVSCDGEGTGASVHLLQTGLASIGSSAGVLAAATADEVQHRGRANGTADRVAVSLVQASQSAGAGAAVEAQGGSVATGTASAGARTWTFRASSGGGAMLVVLPILGFMFAVGAICTTVFLENGLPDVNQKKDVIGHSPFALPARRFGGRGAEGLLQVQGGPAGDSGFRAPQAGQYHRPTLNHAAIGGPVMQPVMPAPPPLMMPAPAAPAVAGAGPEVQIMIPSVPQGQALGLNLSEENLIITGFADPVAMSYGFQVGDRIMALNGMLVAHQDDFVLHLQMARERNAAFGEPLVFGIYRHPGGYAAEAVADSHDLKLWIGTWEYQDESHDTGRHLYKIRKDPDGSLIFEQALPDGQGVIGVLQHHVGDDAMTANLHLKGGEPHGVARIRLGGKGVLVSNFEAQGGGGFGEDIYARRVAEKATKKSRGRMC
mmetsp:Transcript_73584/g.186570  ORF Transcript_73584/g.186570 Transcript_73584/m.186570 type:complete len:464 (-) Transcript_73584:122-1513(-)